MKTIYIQRQTEDPDEDIDKIKSEMDLFIDGRYGSKESGLLELARILKNQDAQA